MENPVKVAVTGAAGQIGYSLLFRIASGEVFGKRPVRLSLVELPAAVKAAEGTAMELSDCGFAALDGIDIADNPQEGFRDCSWVLMVGSKPRGPGMERKDLIKENGPIFVAQGRALEGCAHDVRVVVVGNPCNTNCLIALRNAPDIPKDRFSAMTMLDENRAKAQLAEKLQCNVGQIGKMAIWGNHSATMFPDFENAVYDGKPVAPSIGDRGWLETDFITTVQKRGAAIIAARGKSSAASAASACLDHVRSYLHPTKEDDWFSAGIYSDGSYGVTEGLVFSFPVRMTQSGAVEIVQGLPMSSFAKDKIQHTEQELIEERSVVADLLN